MITAYRHEQLGHANHGWLDTRHHFSFASYRNPQRMQFGQLRVINDDVIKAGGGFGMHGHKNMEIITFVRSGAITHKDSKGNVGRTEAGDVQVMSAGTGIFHSEYNMESADTAIFQIWILPREKDVAPRWEAISYASRTADEVLPLLVSGRTEDQRDGVLYIHQDAAVSGGLLKAGTQVTQPVLHQAYLLVSSGQVEVGGLLFNKGDGAEITGMESVTLKALHDAEVILIDVPA